MKAREGDLLEDTNGIIFDVKGLIQPPNRIVAFPRFLPHAEGERKRGKIIYRKIYAIHERLEWLKQNLPHYLVYDKIFDELLCEVPVNSVKRHYIPVKGLEKIRKRKRESLDNVESAALEFAELLKNSARVSCDKIGISGSLLAGLHTPNSDIDLVIYGAKECQKAYQTLETLLNETKSLVQRYTKEELKCLFDFRSKDTITSFEDFLRTEKRKISQGKFMNRDYFIRFVKDWTEINEEYGDIQYENVGYAKIKATIVDDSEAIFTPCNYKINNVKVLMGVNNQPLKEIVSFRGRFCEQAKNGETVIAQGKVEKVRRMDTNEYYRILLGNNPTDFMILA